MALVSTPLNPNNAIESATFVIGLARGLSKPTLDLIAEKLLEFDEELPGESASLTNLQMGGLIGVNHFAIETQEAARFVSRPNGTLEWTVQAVGNLVQVQCFNYTNFADVWARARRYLLCALSAVESEIPAVEVGFQVIDKFLYPDNAEWDEYDMAELFNVHSGLLTPKSQKSGALWHVFQGWFESHPPTRVLHQLNISNTVLQPKRQLCAIIDHRGALRTAEDNQLFELRSLIEKESNGSVELDAIFKNLHDKNRDTIEDLLNSAKLQQIGIKKGS